MRRALLAILGLALSLSAPAAGLTVFAAASLKEALDEASRSFEAATGHRVTASYAASNALARQIDAGAPADFFISADADWIDHVERRGRAVPGSRRALLGNELVLIAPAASKIDLTLQRGADLVPALQGRRLALAHPEVVPAGRYAKAAFTSLGLWGALEGRLAATDNVRMALALVARGEARLGVVYRTDALAEPRVRIVAGFPPGSYPPIVYPMVRLKRATSAAALELDRWLQGPEAGAIFARHGFRRP